MSYTRTPGACSRPMSGLHLPEVGCEAANGERRCGKTHDAVVASDAEIAQSTLRTQCGNVKCITTPFSGNSPRH